MLENLINAIGGRKAVLTLTILAAGTAVDLLTERGLSVNLMTLFMAAGGGFLVTNVASKYAVGYIKSKGEDAPALDTTELDKKIQAISNRQQELVVSSESTVKLLTQIVTAMGKR